MPKCDYKISGSQTGTRALLFTDIKDPERPDRLGALGAIVVVHRDGRRVFAGRVVGGIDRDHRRFQR